MKGRPDPNSFFYQSSAYVVIIVGGLRIPSLRMAGSAWFRSVCPDSGITEGLPGEIDGGLLLVRSFR